MPQYVFHGRHVRTNESVAGERLSSSPQALAAVLRREQVAPISIREKRSRGFRLAFRRKLSQAEIAIFARQFSVMLDAGLPLVQCLKTIAQQHTDTNFKSTLEQVRSDVEAGSRLADAMARHPQVFNSLFTNMIAAGEAGGILDAILQRLALFTEKVVKLKSALKSAAIYPSVILFIAIVVVIIILWKVIPVFRTLFEGFHVELPLLTRLVIAASSFIESYFVFIAAAFVLGGFGCRRYYRTENGRRAVDGALLEIPVIGSIFRKIAVARFTRTLATLLSSGVPILEGLDITARTAGNAILEDVVKRIRRRIEEGKTISDPMRESNFFPPMVTQMVAVGESTGKLDAMLVKVADYYEEDVDTVAANLLTIVEPFLLVVLGIIVGGIVIAMYLPLFRFIQVLSGEY
jgi:type IV pilus assembly protein PilC